MGAIMSIDATCWAWDAPVRTASQRIVLLSMADKADENGLFLSEKTALARETCLNENQLEKVFLKLEDMGLIRAVLRHGMPTAYQLVLGAV